MLITDGYLTCIPGWWMALPALPIAWWIWRVGLARGQVRGLPGQIDRRWTLLALLALAHVTVVIALTIFPIPISGQDYYRVTRGFSEDNVIPFATIVGQIRHLGLWSTRELAGNALLLVPLGVYGPALWPQLRDWRRFAAVALAFAVAIELGQLAGSLLEGFTYRVTDVDDAMMNASGALFGFFVWRWLEVWEPVRGRLERMGLADTNEGRPSTSPVRYSSR